MKTHRKSLDEVQKIVDKLKKFLAQAEELESKGETEKLRNILLEADLLDEEASKILISIKTNQKR